MQGENKLKQWNISYKDFVQEMASPSSAKDVMLSHHAAVSLCKNGFGNNFFIVLMSSTFPIWIIIGLVLAIFINFEYIFLILLVPVQFKITKHLIVRSVWKELCGDGKTPYDLRENVYNRLVQHDELRANSWETEKPGRKGK